MAASRKRKASDVTVERGTIEQAMAIIGLPIRTVQAMAARAEIPGAAKFGRRWTFDLAKLRKLVAEREQQSWLNADRRRRADATGAATRYGGACVRPAVPREGSVSPYTLVIQRLRGSGSKPKKHA
jgi:hypothetical protein